MEVLRNANSDSTLLQQIINIRRNLLTFEVQAIDC